MFKAELKRAETLAIVTEKMQMYNNVIAELPTGYGKTLVGIQQVCRYVPPTGKFLFVVPEIPLIENAKKEFHKHGYSVLLDKGTFICYASLHLYKGHQFDLIIFDEVHHLVSEKRIDAAQQIIAKKRIGLSATIDDTTKELLAQVANWTYYTKTLQEAIDDGVLAEPKIVYIDVKLDNTVKRNKYKYRNKEFLLTDKEYYDELSATITYWRQIFEDLGTPYSKNMMLSAGSKRKSFLADCKEEAAKKLIEELGDNRFICFCGSVAQAKRLGKKNVCSSHSKKNDNLELIERFNRGEINSLFAKDMLKEGVNLVNTHYGILIQPGSKEKEFVQMLGRTLRSASPTFYIIRALDTVDERFIRTQTRQLNNQSFSN